MSLAAASTPPRWKSVSLWVVRGLLALAFAGAGGAKLYGVPMMVQEFEHIGLGQWFRYLTGTLELLGAFLILVPSLAAFGALLLIGIMIGAIVTHLFVIGGSRGARSGPVGTERHRRLRQARPDRIACQDRVRLLRCAFPAAN